MSYDRLARLLRDFASIPVVDFDTAAATAFSGLVAQRVRIGAMDLRIAAIALGRGLTVLSRNLRDFRKVPNLVVEDWTV